mgnify:FL=1
MPPEPKQVILKDLTDLEFARLRAEQKNMLQQAIVNDAALEAEQERREKLVKEQANEKPVQKD